MEEKVVKVGFASLTSILVFIEGSFTPLLYVMIFFEILDFITGVASAVKNKGGIESKEAVWGFIKKISYFILVGVAFGFDYLIIETSHIAGIDFHWPSAFGVISICYLIATEGISILENLEELGIHVPFLTIALKAYKDKISSDKEAS